ncbi:hypothetical protein OFY17_00085 [Marinomonas sp. C2222]|uniref:Aggregation factor core n=1 Tax=Marinomonas sargassi TaxID=2984494 RepID=A0ABT2YNE8_9GAMM|nr:hypothetical protein [Marinomonas sargassi]MCV2401270.1 hypothetical protein [Marinomonas sargassi]
MKTLFITCTTPMIFLISSLAQANLDARFIESAPKDRFVLSNTSQCDIQNITANIDLSNSTGKLIFDTTATGAGVEVFQPFEASNSNMQLTNGNKVNDGATGLSVKIATLKANDSVHFTIDVDDTLKRSELGNIRVSGSEIENATIEITAKDQTASKAAFDNRGKASLALASC